MIIYIKQGCRLDSMIGVGRHGQVRVAAASQERGVSTWSEWTEEGATRYAFVIRPLLCEVSKSMDHSRHTKPAKNVVILHSIVG